MKRVKSIAAAAVILCTVLGSAPAAAAALLFSFSALPGAPYDDFSFVMDSSPTPASVNPSGNFTIENVDLTVGGVDYPGNAVTFYAVAPFTIAPDISSTYPFNYEGFQLFSGTLSAPMFSPGVFPISVPSQFFGSTPAGTLTISALPGGVPEPGTWTMMLVGLGAMGFALRRRRSPVLGS